MAALGKSRWQFIVIPERFFSPSSCKVISDSLPCAVTPLCPPAASPCSREGDQGERNFSCPDVRAFPSCSQTPGPGSTAGTSPSPVPWHTSVAAVTSKRLRDSGLCSFGNTSGRRGCPARGWLCVPQSKAGTLGEAWAQLKKSLADEAEVHLKFSSKLQSEVEKPLLNFRENFKKDMKKCDHHIADLRKHLASRYTAVEKARKALTERQKDLEMKTQQLEVKLSNKTEEEIKKARRKSTQAGDDLMRCVDLYNQAQSKWFEEMVTTTLELERLEVERVEMIRQHLCQYTQLRHETDMFNQSTVELVDQLLRKVDPAKDRELWVKEHKTGDIRPVDMEI
uniref:Growth arrest specific 7 n=1 Tax=Serinus canaria TaxID=9135 RepID=A0A8C9MJS8_SERCA